MTPSIGRGRVLSQGGNHEGICSGRFGCASKQHCGAARQSSTAALHATEALIKQGEGEQATSATIPPVQGITDEIKRAGHALHVLACEVVEQLVSQTRERLTIDSEMNQAIDALLRGVHVWLEERRDSSLATAYTRFYLLSEACLLAEAAAQQAKEDVADDLMAGAEARREAEELWHRQQELALVIRVARAVAVTDSLKAAREVFALMSEAKSLRVFIFIA